MAHIRCLNSRIFRAFYVVFSGTTLFSLLNDSINRAFWGITVLFLVRYAFPTGEA